MKNKIIAFIITCICAILFIIGTKWFVAYAEDNEVILASQPTVEEVVEIGITPSIIYQNPLMEKTAAQLEAVGSATAAEEDSKEIKEEEVESAIDWAAKEAEYPTATYIWKYLKKCGYSDAVTAGILGNMMTEVGGWISNYATMNLDVCNSGKTYYGLCQWKKKIYPQVVGCDLDGQLAFLINTIQNEYRDFGRGYTYATFLQIESPTEAALSFAKTYERCSSSSYKRRQTCAQIAYDYFTK